MASRPLVMGLLVGAFLIGSVAISIACEMLVRDAAFRTPRDMHRLCVMAHAGDESAQSTMDQLSAWLAGPGKDLNVQLEQVDVDDPDIRWSDYGIPSAPPDVPVVVLVGRGQGMASQFVIQHWEPAPSPEDLLSLADSPVRQLLQEKLIRRLAVLLYAPGHGVKKSAGDAAGRKETLNQAVAKWRNHNKLGVALVRIDRTDIRERTLLSFAGIPREGPDWVGVTFGRGKLIGPPLVGSDITRDRLDELIEPLTQECACSKPLPTMGVDLPLVWRSPDDAVVAMGDSVEELAQAETGDMLPSLTQVPISETGISGDIVPGQLVNADAAGSSLLTVTLCTLGVTAFFVLGISCTMLWRNHR